MKKGIITVIVITILVGLFICLQALGIMAGLLDAKAPVIFIFLAICVFLALMGAFLYTSYERIREIKEEDKDDISKY